MPRVVSESEIGWTVPVNGFAVLGVTFGYLADITAYGDRAEDEKIAPNTNIRVEGSATFVDARGTEHSLNGQGSWESLTPLLSLRNDRITSCVADRAGWLTVEFESGAILKAGPDGHYENWQVAGPNGILIVGLPSGGPPAMWNAVDE